jgi:mycothiol synthase
VAPDGQIAAYASVIQRRNVQFFFEARVHPAYRGQGLGSHLLALVEQRAAELVPLAPPDAQVTLSGWCYSANQAAKQLLEAAGFVCNRHTWAMAIELPDPPAPPAWPAGITLRPFVAERDARAVFEADEEAFQDHWGYLPNTFENWYRRRIASDDNFDPSLWFIAMDGEEIAGMTLCGYYLQDGIVNILGVRRPWRRHGLGLALLHHAFGEFYRRGTRKVTLGVDSQNLTGATRIYKRAGMYIELSYDQYEKELRPGVDPSTRVLKA